MVDKKTSVSKKSAIESPNTRLLFLMEYLLKKFDYKVCSSEEGISIIGDGYLAIGIIKPVESSPESFVSFIKKTITSEECDNKRFVLIPLLLSTKVGILIIDTFKKTAEHFEPNGSLKDTRYETACSILENVIISSGLKFLKPETSCPSFGSKTLNSYCSQTVDKDSCYLWSIWYSELRIEYPHIQAKDLLFKVKDNVGVKFCKFISEYTQSVTDFSKKYQLISRTLEGVKSEVSYKLKSAVTRSVPKSVVNKSSPKAVVVKAVVVKAVVATTLNKKKPLRKNRLFIQLGKQRPIVAQLSMGNKSLALYKKNNFEWKKNILRNRPIEYVLKNLNSNKKLSFYKL